MGQVLLTTLFAASMIAVGWLAWRVVQRQEKPTRNDVDERSTAPAQTDGHERRQ